MGFLSHLLFPWGLLLQVFAIIHFIRRRPDMFLDFHHSLFSDRWVRWSTLLSRCFPTRDCSGSPLRYFHAASASARLRPRSATIHQRGTTRNSVISIWRTASSSWREPPSTKPLPLVQTHSIPFIGVGVCAILLGDAAAAIPDLERAVREDPDYDFYRAAGLLAHRLRADGTKGKSRSAIPQYHCHVDLVRDLSEFCQSSGIRGDATPKPANGHRKCWTRNQRCRTTSAAGSAPGSEVRAAC